MSKNFIFGTAGLHRIAWRPARHGLLRLAFDTGFRAFDTAPLYGNGLTETEIGIALASMRNHIQITTKFGIPVSLYGAARPWTFAVERLARMALDRKYRASFDRREWTVSRMRTDLEGSLRRLRTERVERFCLHEPLDIIPMGVWNDLCAEAENMKRQGKIGAFGLSGEQPCMAELASRPGLDFVQTRIGKSPESNAPLFVYGVFGQFRASGQRDFNAYLSSAPGGPQMGGYLLSSTKPHAVAAYAPLFG